MIFKKDKLFCEINPTCYEISRQKEILKRHIKNMASNDKFSNTKTKEKLPNLVASYSCALIKKGKGIDPVLQKNKAAFKITVGSTVRYYNINAKGIAIRLTGTQELAAALKTYQGLDTVTKDLFTII